MDTKIIQRPLISLVFYATIVTQVACSPSDPGNAISELVVVETDEMGVVVQDDNLRGRDGGYSGTHNGRTVWVFGDTVTISANSDGQNWFSNTWSAVEPSYASDGLAPLTLGTDEFGEPVELLPYTDEEIQFNRLHQDAPGCLDPCGARWALWPGPLIDDPVRQRSLLFYQKINAEPGDFNFYGVGSALAEWPYGARHPVRPVINALAEHPTIMFPPGTPQLHSAALVEDNMLYVFACDKTDSVFPCKLARTSMEQAMEPGAWRYAATNGIWVSDSSEAIELFHGADIMSVSFNEFLDRYIAVYSKPLSRKIVIRSALALTGPWSTPTHVANALPSASGNGWVYDALSHPQLSEQNEAAIYVTYTRDLGTAWFAREMRLLRVTLSARGE